MVNVGRPSQGCHSCRARRIKVCVTLTVPPSSLLITLPVVQRSEARMLSVQKTRSSLSWLPRQFCSNLSEWDRVYETQGIAWKACQEYHNCRWTRQRYLVCSRAPCSASDSQLSRNFVHHHGSGSSRTISRTTQKRVCSKLNIIVTKKSHSAFPRGEGPVFLCSQLCFYLSKERYTRPLAISAGDDEGEKLPRLDPFLCCGGRRNGLFWKSPRK